jgi:hypothetical protein
MQLSPCYVSEKAWNIVAMLYDATTVLCDSVVVMYGATAMLCGDMWLYEEEG